MATAAYINRTGQLSAAGYNKLIQFPEPLYYIVTAMFKHIA